LTGIGCASGHTIQLKMVLAVFVRHAIRSSRTLDVSMMISGTENMMVDVLISSRSNNSRIVAIGCLFENAPKFWSP
jgi:hypothetical protein